jgi:hypothetical protein
MNLTHNDAVRILRNLDQYIARFERDTGKIITDGARKYIVEMLCEKIEKRRLN